MFNYKTWAILFVPVMVIALAFACGGDDYFEEYDSKVANQGSGGGGEAPSGTMVTVDPATAATVTGSISFSGEVPRFPPVNMSAEPDCMRMHQGRVPSDRAVVNDGKLQYVLVWVSKGLEGKNFPVRTDKVTLNQEGCIYKPHVVAVQKGQPFNVINSDETTHNVHPLPRDNREWNKSQTARAPAIEYAFPRAEIKIAVKCNIHPWMQAYIHVLEHPYFSVSSADGSFEIGNLPPGTYTVQALHEQLGEQEMEITVGSSESKQLDFEFTG
jgi:plastocyanin